MATLLKVLNNLADIKSAGVLHFALELGIGENLRWSAEGLLGVDDPIEATHGSQMCGERGGISQIGETA